MLLPPTPSCSSARATG